MVKMILESNSIDKEILFNQKLNDGSTALMLAIKSNKLEMIHFMMENNVKEDPTNDGTTVPMALSSSLQFDLIKHFLNNGKHDIFAQDNYGRDILYLSSKYNVHFEDKKKYLLFEFLIQNGFSPNHQFVLNHNWNKLTYNVESLFQIIKGDIDLAITIIKLGADYVETKNKNPHLFDRQLLMKIKEFECEIQDPTEIIHYQSDPVKYLFLSVIHNRIDILKEILKQLDCTELKDSNGNNILGLSVISYRMNIFDFIMNQLNWRSMIKQKNNEGLLPLHLALQRANYMVVRKICELSEGTLNIDNLCFEKTRIHRNLFYFLHQWKLMENSMTMDINFHFL
jgi:hypothetical protein